MLKKLTLFAVVLLGICSKSPAAQVSVGQIGLLGGQFGYQQFLVYNLTGSGCASATTFPYVCDSVNFTNWSVEVDYNDSNGVAQTPSFNSGLLIAPGNDPTSSPQAVLPYDITNTCPPCDAVVTRVVFQASLNPASFQIFDPGSSSYSTFFAQSPFSFTYTPSLDYQSGNPSADFTDLLAGNAVAPPPSGGSVPEPASFSLMIAGALAMSIRRIFAR